VSNINREKNLTTYGLASILLSASFLMTVPANQYQNIFAQTEGEIEPPEDCEVTNSKELEQENECSAEGPVGTPTISNPSWTSMLTGVQSEQFKEQFNKLSEQFKQDVLDLVSADSPTEADPPTSSDIDSIAIDDIYQLATLFNNYKQETFRIFDTTPPDPYTESPSSAPPGVDPNKCIPGNECPPVCPDGFIRASPPLNPQLGCLPGSETTEHEKTDEENRDSGSTLSAVPEDGEPVDGSEEEGEVPRNDDTDGDRGGS
jgi:hypothetical protein